jgi:hypothetical protein
MSTEVRGQRLEVSEEGIVVSGAKRACRLVVSD